MSVSALPLAVGEGIVDRYAAYGPLVASFLANALATFGDKGQLVVVVLAARYGARRVFVGAMGAFALWSALEVVLGSWITSVLPDGPMTAVTGALFVAFGIWTLRGALRDGEAGPAEDAPAGTSVLLPGMVAARLGTYGGTATAFVFVLFAEFGDKTQLLTINLATWFPDAPLAVFVGVVAALGLRTGIDAWLGERFERWIPTRLLEFAGAAIFVAFGLAVVGLLPTAALVGIVLAALLGCVVGALSLRADG